MKTVFDLHTHTVSSGHAYSTIQENATYASNIGLEILGISDHAPKMPGAPLAYYFANQKIIPEKLFGVRILKGAELNILDINGNVDLYGEILEGLDFAIASLHPPCIPFGNIEENTQALVNAMKNPKINIIGHPGDPRYPFDIAAVVSAAISTNTLLEINNSSLNTGGIRAGGEETILELIKACKKRDYPIILGSDAHICFEIGGYGNIYKLLDEVNMPQELILNTSVKNLSDFLSNLSF
jgi:putative hydrolase